jgi:hypothetical protein
VDSPGECSRFIPRRPVLIPTSSPAERMGYARAYLAKNAPVQIPPINRPTELIRDLWGSMKNREQHV